MSNREIDNLIANTPRAENFSLADLVAYEDGKKNSLVLVQRKDVMILLFALDQGQRINRHTTPGDACVQVLDGVAEIEIGDQRFVVPAGEAIVMPANIPHQLEARQAFKMMLTVIKENKSGEEE